MSDRIGGEEEPMRVCQHENCGHEAPERFGGLRDIGEGEKIWLCLVHKDFEDEKAGRK